jgi:hypothetical protein
MVDLATADGDDGWWVAATVHLPTEEALTASAPVLVLLPGGGYNRRYFDLPAPGFSQAAHHTARGLVVVALDHLGTGESVSLPPTVTTLPVVATANHAAVTEILDRLRAGSLAPGVRSVAPAVVVGAGQSLGGHALAGMQALHRTFDGLAFLGSSLAGTVLPPRPGMPAASTLHAGATAREAALASLAQADWPWIFHWETEPGSAGAALVAADLAAGVPARGTPPPWGSSTYPGFGVDMMVPGALAGPAARVDVPVLLARGERDVCRPPGEEVAVLAAATDLSLLAVPRMAHMHNFAETRAVLWRRLDEFVAHVARGGR